MIAIDPISVPSPGNLPPSDPGDFDFKRSSRASASEQSVPLGGVPRALREAAEGSGLDPLAELYNEALRYAQEGHLRLARERLQMLLCMAPDDGEARLMLARVHVAGQRWSEALAALDEAAACGVDVPMSLRRAVEDHLQAEHAAADEQKTAVRAREQGEVKALRNETRRLRSDNAQLVGRIADLEKEVRKWAWATAGVSALAILSLAGSLLFGGGGGAEPTAAPVEVVAEAPAEGVAPEAPTEGGPTAIAPATGPGASTLAAKAAAALDTAEGLEGASLDLSVQGDKATLRGTVRTFKQRRAAEKVLAQVGLSSVDADAVVVESRTIGTVHVVGRGDTLSHIASAYYGDSTLIKPIEQANGVDVKNLKIGQTLKIPPVQ